MIFFPPYIMRSPSMGKTINPTLSKGNTLELVTVKVWRCIRVIAKKLQM